jgi:hypothetical protein
LVGRNFVFLESVHQMGQHHSVLDAMVTINITLDVEVARGRWKAGSCRRKAKVRHRGRSYSSLKLAMPGDGTLLFTQSINMLVASSAKPSACISK